MSDLEKINIYVPGYVGEQLDKDANMFEVVKRNGRTINRNRFLCMLIKGYYNSYAKKCQDDNGRIVAILNDNGVSSNKAHMISDQILKSVVLPIVPSRKGKKPAKLSLKPTKDTESLIINIRDNLGGDDYVSQYFCRMLMSYCENAFSERERIIFSENYKLLEEACAQKRPINFSTIWNPNVIHSVIPYRLAVGQEEMYNYLLCAETDCNSGIQKAKSFRINRISKINYGWDNTQIDTRVIEFLEKMLQYSPQFAIDDDDESCVRLTESGRIKFSRIYYGRPLVYRIEETEEGYYYYFKGSKDQLFLYFLRFGCDAEIIAPLSLRERLATYFSESCKNYI